MSAPADDRLSVLRSYLTSQRRHVLGIVDGLDDDQLRSPVLPSGWSCLGMIQHLALDDELFWFSAVMAADPSAIAASTADNAPDAWAVSPDTPAESVLDLYRAQIDRSDTVMDAMVISTPPAWWPDFFGEWRLDDLQDVLLHLITETACHAGHLDAARELIDGRQWLVVP